MTKTTDINASISASFRASFESHPARQTDPALALESAREAASAEIPDGVTGTFDDETLTFTADEPSEPRGTQLYRWRMPWGEVLQVSANLTEASAPIALVAEDGIETTQYQTADCRHRSSELLRLIVRHMGAEWYVDPSCTASEEEQYEAAIDGAVEL